jgi:uncharacterized protein YjbI with pentapeptide repeats
MLDVLLERHPIVVVRADFGHGKSLTARTVAWRAAQSYLQNKKSSVDIFRPVFVKCAEDFESHADELGKVLKRAEWRLARALGLDVSLDDIAFEKPSAGKVLYLIDGLDEVALGEQEVKSLFLRMKEKSSKQCRFIVFTRPAALGHGVHLRDVPILDLQPFSCENGYDELPGGQVGKWLRLWAGMMNQSSAITVEDLRSRGLLEISGTPILLFMIAFTWDEYRGGRASLVAIYESFFRQIARGKHEQDRDRNRPIAEASAEILRRLIELGHVDSEAEPPEAMLWLMSRVAWKSRCLEDSEWLEGRKRVLRIYDVQKILEEELEIQGDARLERVIQLGVLLALQADLEEGNARILFGHQSFREFLVGRYWAGELRRRMRGGDRNWERVKDEPLLQGRLLGKEDASFRFLSEHTGTWSLSEREHLFRWAEDCFNDERLVEGASAFREDRRVLLREAALAIGSSLLPTQGIHARHPWTLRSVLAWFWMLSQEPMILAPKFQSPGADLSNADLGGADLRESDLSGAKIMFANLDASDLSGANLTDVAAYGVSMDRVNLRSAILQGANLSGASLCSVVLSKAEMVEANLRGANMTSAELGDADMRDSDLSNANLADANLRGADLSGSKLRGASFWGARLGLANLSNADLSNAVLAEANLYGAVLGGAILCAADMREAKYHPAQLVGANTDGLIVRDRAEYDASDESDEVEVEPDDDEFY